MSDTKLDPRSLQEKAQSLIHAHGRDTASQVSCRFREWVQAVTDLLEPASEPAKVECPNCRPFGEPGGCTYCPDHLPQYRQQPAQPEPVAEEMPEAVLVNTWQLEELLKYADLAEVSLRTGFHPPEFLFEPADRSLRQCIDAIKEQRDQRRTHAAQPAKVRMTETADFMDELWGAMGYPKLNVQEVSVSEAIARKAIETISAQAAEAGKVRLPKVRAFLDHCLWFSRDAGIFQSALTELDAVEGVKG